jgi:glyceraldehyde 3-phosphate dehydrogenase
MNIVPSETGAAKAVGLVIPEPKGKFTGMAFRVPTSTVPVIDFTAVSRGPQWSRPSSDSKGDPHSSIFSTIDTLVIGGDLAKVVAWYDNEWGCSLRVADLDVSR